ncbi:hypothetical protein Taro_006366 [Colocasia esculenta]|uniref:Uncharacterized protein n=1 Tax=Colocasia esculenta TaxID=4460 RepID=A0A843TSB8_COLES|nr:hypothetical protein [Colocasia esculenta]
MMGMSKTKSDLTFRQPMLLVVRLYTVSLFLCEEKASGVADGFCPAVGLYTVSLFLCEEKASGVAGGNDIWDKLKLTYEGEPIVVEVQDKDERIESVGETEEAKTHDQEESGEEASQVDILPHEEEDVKEEPQIEGEPHTFLKENLPEEVSVKEAFDEEEVEGKAHKFQLNIDFIQTSISLKHRLHSKHQLQLNIDFIQTSISLKHQFRFNIDFNPTTISPKISISLLHGLHRLLLYINVSKCLWQPLKVQIYLDLYLHQVSVRQKKKCKTRLPGFSLASSCRAESTGRDNFLLFWSSDACQGGRRVSTTIRVVVASLGDVFLWRCIDPSR